MSAEKPATPEPSESTQAQPRSGVIIAAGRLTVREICVLAAERSGATGISADGFRIHEEAGW
jgi:hypothetical protein